MDYALKGKQCASSVTKAGSILQKKRQSPNIVRFSQDNLYCPREFSKLALKIEFKILILNKNTELPGTFHIKLQYTGFNFLLQKH